MAVVVAGRTDAVAGLPTWVRWIIVTVVGLSPILTFWMAKALGHYLRHKLRTKLSRSPKRPPIKRNTTDTRSNQ